MYLVIRDAALSPLQLADLGSPDMRAAAGCFGLTSGLNVFLWRHFGTNLLGISPEEKASPI